MTITRHTDDGSRHAHSGTGPFGTPLRTAATSVISAGLVIALAVTGGSGPNAAAQPTPPKASTQRVTAIIDGKHNPLDASCADLKTAIGKEVQRGAQKYSTGDLSNISDSGDSGAAGGIPGTFQELFAANLIQISDMKGCVRNSSNSN